MSDLDPKPNPSDRNPVAMSERPSLSLRRSDRRRRQRQQRHQTRAAKPRQIPLSRAVLLGLLLGLTIVGSGLVAAAMLFKLPDEANCRTLFLPTTTAARRLYCARTYADRNTVESLLEAIDLVDELPADHALRPEVDRQLELWAEAILDLAETDFQAGDLEQAVATAERIPLSAMPDAIRNRLAIVIADRVKGWQGIWDEATKIAAAIERELDRLYWGPAFQQVTRLLGIGNRYWETTRYQEYAKAIQLGRQDSSKVERARGIAARDDVDSVLEAIKLVQEIGLASPLRLRAQTLLRQFGQQLIDIADRQLEADDLPGAIATARKVPSVTGLKPKANDFVVLARARYTARRPTATNLEAAIAQARAIEFNSPIYGEAQDWIARWQDGLGQVAILERARTLASSGQTEDLRLAIATAREIPTNNALWERAESEIDRWSVQLDTEQDRPILARARELANQGELEAAIATASQIQATRPLYDEAQRQIVQWQGSIARQGDTPTLARARGLADSGNIDAAIAAAQEITYDSLLYDEAQAAIGDWIGQTLDREELDEAYELASYGTAEGFDAAIRTASGISSGSYLAEEGARAIELWSRSLLSIATERANTDLLTAIDIARRPTANHQLGSADPRQCQSIIPPFA
ncbi:MAG: chromosome segregation ATPase [Oscillatoriales cyanobacterium]|nr:MAG: chromosome segregation ATPase [Oscillatoriales cyanobacterium]